MADSSIQVAPDSTGKLVDAASLTNGTAQTVYRQTVTIGDPAAINQVANVVNDALNTSLASYHTDAFNQLVVGERQNDFQVQFFGSGNPATQLNITQTGSATANWTGGQCLFSTGATNPSTLLATSLGSVSYETGSELFAYFTAYWSSNSAGTFQRIGLTDKQNGFFVGFEGTSFSVSKISGGSITSVAQASFNLDTLTGATGSNFTRAGVPEAVNFTYQNVFRIRFGWLGSASIVFEIYSPDGYWIPFHIIRNPNTQSTPSVQTPNLPISVWMSDTGNNFTLGTSCWCGGSTSPYVPVNAPINNQTQVARRQAFIRS
jgi:hypothetical protein